MIQILAELTERDLVFNNARYTADRLRKPLLNAGCGAWYRKAIMQSDVNMDVKPRNAPNFVLGNIEDMSMFGDKQFGAVFCSHVLEHVNDLEKAKAELLRVSDYQYIITPSPLFPFTLINPLHRRVFADTIGEKVLVEKYEAIHRS